MTRILAFILLTSTLMSAQVIDPTTRTVTTSNFLVTWNTGVDTEAITTLDWMGSPNVTSTYELDACGNTGEGGNVQYFGNAWGPPDPQVGGQVLVGGGTITPQGTSPWSGHILPFGTAQITINSNSTNCPPSSAGINVQTTYRFSDPADSAVNWFEVQRVFDFTAAAFNYDLRPYILRLNTGAGYTDVLYPAANGVLASIPVFDCSYGCTGPISAPGAASLSPAWVSTQGWFALYNPTTKQGVIVKRTEAYDPQGSPIAAQLWIDYDGPSGSYETSSPSVLLLEPPGGFTGGLVSETETMCFFNSATWTPSLTPPAGCRNNIAHLSPSTLTFAGQSVGVASTPRIAVVSNIGSHGVIITSIVASGDYLAVNNCPETLPTGGSCEIAVSFVPVAPGIRSGFVDIDMPGENEHLSLAGLGVAAE